MRVLLIVIVVVIVTWESKANSSSTCTELQTGTELGKSFKSVSRSFVLARSYPSRRRACFSVNPCTHQPKYPKEQIFRQKINFLHRPISTMVVSKLWGNPGPSVLFAVTVKQTNITMRQI